MTNCKNTQSWKRYLFSCFSISKMREKGVVWCFKKALGKIYWGGVAHRVGPKFVEHAKKMKIFLMNLFNFLSSGKQKKVILGIWDYKLMPWSVGDLLTFIETLSVLKLQHNADRVDVCVVCDKENPAGNRGYKNINSSNFHYYLFSLLPIINTSPYLGSVFQFDSRSEFNSFLKKNINKYILYPSLDGLLKETFNFHGGADFKEIHDFKKKHGFVPSLAIDDYHLSWAHNFYKSKIEDRIPVAVALRNRPDGAGSNTDQQAWLGFFDLCKIKFPTTVFVIIGTREEAFDGLKTRENVIVAKDYGSTLSDDFALMRTSFLFMGMCSGINIISIFSDHPFLIFGRRLNIEKQCRLTYFHVKYQKTYFSTFLITPDSLFREFSELYSQLDIEQWRKKDVMFKRPLLSYATWNW